MVRRVAIFDAYPHVYGGAQRSAHLLALGLPTLGWEPTVVTTGEGVLTDRLRADGVEPVVVEVPPALRGYGRRLVGRRAARAGAAIPRYEARLLAAFRRLAPDVVHVASHRGLLLAGLPGRAVAPLVWHVGARGTPEALNRAGAALASAVVVPALGTTWVLPALARCRRVVEAASPIPDRVRRDAPVTLTDRPVIVSTGRLHPDKGFDVAVRALALIRRDVPDARLVIVGGPQEGHEQLPSELTQLAHRLGVGGAVDLVGFQADPHQHVAGARAYVQPSRPRTEILPLAIVEAMATGVPVVATDVGAIADVVRPEETGLLVPAEEPDALAGALRRVLTDRPLADRLRQAAYAAVAPPARTEASFMAAVAGAYEAVVAP